MRSTRVSICAPCKTNLVEPSKRHSSSLMSSVHRHRQQVTASLNAMAISHVQQHDIPGSRFRNVKVSVVVQGLVTRRLSLPAYVLAYRYKHKLYRVVICGQNAQLIIGKAPYSTAKIVLCVLGACMFVIVVLMAAAS